MRKAVIDIGTNSTRLAVADCTEAGIVMRHKAVEITRIGENMGVERTIKPQPLARTMAVVQAFVSEARAQGAEVVRIVATSAVREAVNREQVAESVRDCAALALEVLTGTAEARLSYQGAVGDFAELGPALAVLDIGGGSTELVYGEEGRMHRGSVAMGAVRLSERPALRQQMADILQGLLGENLPADLVLIGVGGTITSLAAMDQELSVYQSARVHGYRLSRQRVAAWLEKLAPMTVQERARLQGLMPKRADIIVQGTEILLQVMALLHCQEIIVSDKDLLDALLAE